jgi:hypothetical protein
MKPEEVYLAWAPPDSIWSPWAIPVPFAQIVCVPLETEKELAGVDDLANGLVLEADLVFVVDLPGADAIRLGLGLALRGFRPVPVIDGSPGPDILGTSQSMFAVSPAVTSSASTAVDMRQTMRWLCIGAVVLPTLKIAANAAPVFLLDALRLGRTPTVGTEVFDNRWKTFPQDFPSAGLLKEHGIRRALLIQDIVRQPNEDLAHVLLRWQEAGISIHAARAEHLNASESIRVNRPTRFRALWHWALALIGLSRAASGGFGAWPQGSGGG